MKIADAKVIVCSPGRNFVTLKVLTDQGVYGLGDATFNGREHAVVAYIEEHCIPALIGRDPRNIEDLIGGRSRDRALVYASIAAI